MGSLLLLSCIPSARAKKADTWVMMDFRIGLTKMITRLRILRTPPFILFDESPLTSILNLDSICDVNSMESQFVSKRRSGSIHSCKSLISFLPSPTFCDPYLDVIQQFPVLGQALLIKRMEEIHQNDGDYTNCLS
jgi:hypothetical protein